MNSLPHHTSQHKIYSQLPSSLSSDLPLKHVQSSSQSHPLILLESTLAQLEAENQELNQLILRSQEKVENLHYTNQVYTEQITNMVRLERNAAEEVNELTLKLKATKDQIFLMKNELKVNQRFSFEELSAENFALRTKINELLKEVSDLKFGEAEMSYLTDRASEHASLLKSEIELERNKNRELADESKGFDEVTSRVNQESVELEERNIEISQQIRGLEMKIKDLQLKDLENSQKDLKVSSNLENSQKDLKVSSRAKKSPSRPTRSLKSPKGSRTYVDFSIGSLEKSKISSKSSKSISQISAFSSSKTPKSPRSILKNKSTSSSLLSPKSVQPHSYNDEISKTILQIQSDLNDLSQLISSRP